MAPQLRNRIVIGAAAVVALAAGIGLALFDRAPADPTALLALSLPDPAGHPQPLAQWRGKVLVVNFWATWCAPCREEMPDLVRAQKEYGAKGLQIVGIAADDAVKVQQFAKEIELNYPALIGGYAAIDLSKDLGNNLVALPFTLILNRQGKVAYTHLGPVKPDKLRDVITELL
jgi:thiol-disulfide isomerase/thioredoxin